MRVALRYVFSFMLTVSWWAATAQYNAARYEIDAKRLGVNFSDKDALPRSREFIRLDSTYYVGWLYEGMFKYDRAADYLGYKNCIAPLRKAFFLFEKDIETISKQFFHAGIMDLHKMILYNSAMRFMIVTPMWKSPIAQCGCSAAYKAGIRVLILWNIISRLHGQFIATGIFCINILFWKIRWRVMNNLPCIIYTPHLQQGMGTPFFILPSFIIIY